VLWVLVIIALVAVGLTAWGVSALVESARDDGVGELDIKFVVSQILIFIAFMFGFVLVMTAAFFGSPAIATDLESGIAQAMLARPLRRSSYLLGRWLGLEELFGEDLAAPRALLRVGLDLRPAAGALGDRFQLGGDRHHEPSDVTPPLLTLSSSVSGNTPGAPRNRARNSRANPFISGARVVTLCASRTYGGGWSGIACRRCGASADRSKTAATSSSS